MMFRYKPANYGFFGVPDFVDDVSAGAPTTWNKYGYVRGKPIDLWDPWGLEQNQVDCSDPQQWHDAECAGGGGGVLPTFEAFVDKIMTPWTLYLKYRIVTATVDSYECFYVVSRGSLTIECRPAGGSSTSLLIGVLTWTQNVGLVLDWVFERDGEQRYYGTNDLRSLALAGTQGVAILRSKYAEEGCVVTQRSWSTSDAFFETLHDPLNGVQAQLGAWKGRAKNNGDGTVTFSVYNRMTMHSLFYHLGFVPQHPAATQGGVIPRTGTIHQLHQWVEANPQGCPN
jgi:hypothetical protein